MLGILAAESDFGKGDFFMSNVISMAARRTQATPASMESVLRDEPVMLLFDGADGIEQRLAFYLFEDKEAVTVSTVLPANAESMQKVPFERLAGLVFISARTTRNIR